MKGNLAPEGAVIKVAGHERIFHQGVARVFDSEDLCFAAIQAGKINPDDVLVIRYEGPRGGPGMREMLAVTAAIKGIPGAVGDRGAADGWKILGGDAWLMAGHVAPEAQLGGPIAAVREGDTITFDVVNRKLAAGGSGGGDCGAAEAAGRLRRRGTSVACLRSICATT